MNKINVVIRLIFMSVSLVIGLKMFDFLKNYNFEKVVITGILWIIAILLTMLLNDNK